MPKRVFILGSGFSRATAPSMPTLSQLSDKLLDEKLEIEEELKKERFKPFFNGERDIEMLLTYLHQDHAWKSEAEMHADRSLFHKIANRIAKEIVQNEVDGLDVTQVPEWLNDFIFYLYKTGETVITFNYDTIIERVGFQATGGCGERPNRSPKYEMNFYSPLVKDIRSIYKRIGESYAGHPFFRLIKLHGSTNWYYTRSPKFETQQIYFVPTRERTPFLDISPPIDGFLEHMERLIIPPVADKSPFYTHALVRTMWSEAAKAIDDADEVYFVGYSLPETDLTVRQLVKSHITEEKKVFIVNTCSARSKSDLVSRYKRYLSHVPISQISQEYIRDNAVQELSRCLFEEAKSLPTRPIPQHTWTRTYRC